MLDIVKGLWYKLRMMGFSINGPVYMFGDNMSVVDGASISNWKISKKHLGFFYHAVREASKDGIWRVWFLKGKYNITNFITKIMSVIWKQKQV